jgi:protoporphyrinogen oxidase
MKPGTLYSVEYFLFNIPFRVSERKLKKILSDELKKPNSKILYKEGKYLQYSSNPKYSKKLEDEESIKNMASIIYDMVSRKQQAFIEDWIKTQFETKLNETVEKFVEREFKNEILPVIIQHINDKVPQQTITQSEFKERVIQVLSDLCNARKT